MDQVFQSVFDMGTLSDKISPPTGESAAEYRKNLHCT